MGKLPINCTRTTTSEQGRLVATFNCLACGAEGDLRSRTCYGNVLQAFVDEVQIDTVVLADLNHRQYGGGLIELLRAQADLVRATDRAASRAGAASGEKGNACGTCELSPGGLLVPVRDAIARSPVAGADELPALVERCAHAAVPTDHPECDGCVAETRDAARDLDERARAARALLARIAYNLAEVTE